MRLIRFAPALLVLWFVSQGFSQQQPQQQQQQRPLSSEQAAEQQLQEAQRQVREPQAAAGRGNPGLGGGQAQGQAQGRGGAQAAPAPPPDDPDVDAYVNTDDLFSVSVPCKFTKKEITWPTEYDSKVPGNVYNCKNGDTEYEMSVINYTDILKIRRAQEHTAAAGGGGVDTYARIDVAASVDYACMKLRNEAAKITYDAYHYMNLIPGHELQYTLANGRRVYAAAYLHEYRLYIMKATAAPNGIPPLIYTQSFAAIRPDGSAIRYQTIYRHPW